MIIKDDRCIFCDWPLDCMCEDNIDGVRDYYNDDYDWLRDEETIDERVEDSRDQGDGKF